MFAFSRLAFWQGREMTDRKSEGLLFTRFSQQQFILAGITAFVLRCVRSSRIHDILISRIGLKLYACDKRKRQLSANIFVFSRFSLIFPVQGALVYNLDKRIS